MGAYVLFFIDLGVYTALIRIVYGHGMRAIDEANRRFIDEERRMEEGHDTV